MSARVVACREIDGFAFHPGSMSQKSLANARRKIAFACNVSWQRFVIRRVTMTGASPQHHNLFRASITPFVFSMSHMPPPNAQAGKLNTDKTSPIRQQSTSGVAAELECLTSLLRWFQFPAVSLSIT